MVATGIRVALAAGALVVAGGCAQTGGSAVTSTTAPAATASRPPPPESAKEVGEYVGGMPAPGSKFAKLKFGMSPEEVIALIGAPTDTTTHETGKRWIPFYYGADARRVEVLYRGNGCLTYTGGNRFGGGSNELIKIESDAKGACFDS